MSNFSPKFQRRFSELHESKQDVFLKKKLTLLILVSILEDPVAARQWVAQACKSYSISLDETPDNSVGKNRVFRNYNSHRDFK
jgi:hypothetical protein